MMKKNVMSVMTRSDIERFDKMSLDELSIGIEALPSM